MPPCPTTTAAHDLATLFRFGAIGQASDAELLARFASGRGDAASEVAFAALVSRHGPMVLGVCRRILGSDPHASADAFQATFLVLVRKAPAVRVDDSLGRWLYGVTLKVARRAKARARAEQSRTRPFPTVDPAAPRPAGDNDLRVAIDAEIARLPAHYRAAVVLCDLEGLTHEQAARQLRCAVGTVHSRLHRARERLRTGLARRGLAPALVPALRPDVPASLVATTIASASSLLATGRLIGVVPIAVAALTRPFWKEWIMIPGWFSTTLWIALGLVASGAIAPGDGPAQKPRPPAPDAPKAAAPPSITDRFAAIRAEYDAGIASMRTAEKAAKTRDEVNHIYETMWPDEVAFCRKAIDLAKTDITDPGSRDALIWVVSKVRMSDTGPYGIEFARAATLLVRHFGDDPKAVRVGLMLDGIRSFHRDALLTGFLASAKGREAKGLARLAMAKYLENKVKDAVATRKFPGRRKVRFEEWLDKDGKQTRMKEVEESDEDYAYHIELRQCDPTFLAAEVERIYREVITDYGDVRLSRGETLGQAATDRLNALLHLAEGKPAPEIDGVTLDGKPLRLSDYRGKVVVLTFWVTSSRENPREFAHERALLDQHKGRPFAVLGVNCDPGKDAAIETTRTESITWPTWHDPATEDHLGPIASRYHLDHAPISLVIDADGVIRHNEIRDISTADKLINDLLAEQPAKVDPGR